MQKKNAYVWDYKFVDWVFLGCIFKKLLSYLKSAPSNLSKKTNFGVGSAFFHGLDSVPGPLYKVFRLTMCYFCIHNWPLLERSI